MDKKEFEDIIRPLVLLPNDQRKLLKEVLMKNFNKWAENKQLTLTGVGCSLPSKEEISIEAERRNPYVKHLVDFNNGMHEGFIDGADFVLEAIKNKK